MVYKPAAARGRWMDRKGKNLFIEARARCRRKNDRACGSVSSAPRARRASASTTPAQSPPPAVSVGRRGDDVERRERDAFRGEVFVSNASEENLSHRGGVTKGRDVLLAAGDGAAAAARLEANLRTLPSAKIKSYVSLAVRLRTILQNNPPVVRLRSPAAVISPPFS